MLNDEDPAAFCAPRLWYGAVRDETLRGQFRSSPA